MTWQRLEFSTVGADLLEGQEARIADPLWLIGRQWQIGELTGDDAASPLFVEATFAHTPITRFQPGPPDARGPTIERKALGLPLETAVEREAVRSGPAAPRLAAEAGLQLFRLLDSAGADRSVRAALRLAYPLSLPADDRLDPLGRQQLELLARRSFDARALYVKITSGADPGVAGLVSAALTAWLSWYSNLYSEPPAGATSWDHQRMEYRFRIAARPAQQPEIVLDAPEYAGGRLDWYTFDMRNDLPGLGAPEQIDHRHVRVLPTLVRYAGQAASRWWQVEDSAVSFGDMHVAPEDLARVAVAAFAATFGDDWFLIPCHLPVGVLARVTQVTVHDSFGQTYKIRSCAELDGPQRTWRFFELHGDPAADAPLLADRRCPWLFLAPVLPGVTESRPIEDVVLFRDEVANLGWAAEMRVESAAGRVVDRAAQARAAALPRPTATSDAWRYQLATRVLDHQVPLVPVRSRVDGGLYLQRGRLAQSVDGNSVTTRGAIGQLLEPTRAFLIHDAEVPATGVEITRSWQLARTGEGGVVLWVGRRKRPAKPTRAPGLLFDVLA